MLIISLSPERLLASAAKLPMSAQVFVRLGEQLANSDVSLDDLAGTIKLDMALATRVVRVANSPFYRRGEPVAGMDQAISAIGFSQIQDIVNVMIAGKLFAAHLPHYGIKSERILSVAIASSFAARRFAELVGCDPEECYTVALFRSVGRLLLQRIAQEERLALNAVPKEDAEKVFAWERATFGVDAAEVTLRVLQLWKVPPTAIKVLRFVRQRPFEDPAAAVLHLANWVVCLMGEGLELEHGYWKFEQEALNATGLTLEQVETILGATKEELVRVRALLEQAEKP